MEYEIGKKLDGMEEAITAIYMQNELILKVLEKVDAKSYSEAVKELEKANQGNEKE